MMEQLNTPLAYRIRGRSGPLAGKWLWTMTASKGGLPLRGPDWPSIVRQPNQYQFHPEFLDEESPATRVPLQTAEAYLIALKSLGIDAEVVQIGVSTESAGMDEITAQNVFLAKVRAKLNEAVKARGDVVLLRSLLDAIKAIAQAHSEIEGHRQAPNAPQTPFQHRIADVLATASLHAKQETTTMDLEARLDHIREVMSKRD